MKDSQENYIIKLPDEQTGEEHNIDLITLKSIFALVEESKRFSLIPIYRGILEVGSPTEHLQTQEEIRNAHIETMKILKNETLKPMGLTITSEANKTSDIELEEISIEERGLEINIDSSRRYLRFLRNLSEAQVNELDMGNDLYLISYNFFQFIYTSYDLNNIIPEGQEQIDTLKEILKIYNGLGIDTYGVQQLVNHIEQGDIYEYVAIGNESLLSAPEDNIFGPGRWQEDTDLEEFTERWRNAIDILQKAKRNPKASSLYFQLAENLRLCAQKAKIFFDSEKNSYDIETTNNLKVIINDVIQQLSE